MKLFTSYGFLFRQCCPGYVETDMTTLKGWKTIDEGKYLHNKHLFLLTEIYLLKKKTRSVNARLHGFSNTRSGF